MSDPVQLLGKKLDDIIMKLEAMTEAISALINTVQNTSTGLVENVGKLTTVIDKYTDTMTENSKQDFDESREKIMQVTQEVRSLTQVTGTDQTMRINQALYGIVSLLQQAIKPDQIQAQLNEITQFIKMQGGNK